MAWNPSSPAKVGLEWPVLRQRGLSVREGRGRLVRFTPAAARTGDDVKLYLRRLSGSPTVTVEIVPYADLTDTSGFTTTTYRPDADQHNTDFADEGGATTSLFQSVDEATLSESDYVESQVTDTDPAVRWHLPTSGFSTRPVSVTAFAEAYVSGSGVGPNPDPLVSMAVDVGGTLHTDLVSIPDVGTTTSVEQAWPQNPVTDAPWTVTDIVDFDGSTSGVGMSATVELGDPGDGEFLRIFQYWVEVASIIENRVAVGSASPTVAGWIDVTMAAPDGTDTWGLDSGTEYALVVSVRGDGEVVLGALDSGDESPSGQTTETVTIGDVDVSGGTVTDVPTGTGDTDTAVMAWAILDGSADPIPESQPYAALTETEAHSGQTLTQTVDLSTTTDRGWFSVVVRQASTATTEDLTVRLKRSSDDVQVGGDATISPFDVRDDPRLAQIVTVAAASGGTPTAAEHYIELSSSADEGGGWLVTVLDVDGGPSAAAFADEATSAPALTGIARSSPGSQSVSEVTA